MCQPRGGYTSTCFRPLAVPEVPIKGKKIHAEVGRKGIRPMLANLGKNIIYAGMDVSSVELPLGGERSA
jgi:hypothetical protein